MCPPKRPSARMGSSRFTSAFFLMREKEVRFQVSAARSAAKDLGVISIAVRQTPLTAMLSPVLSSWCRRAAATVSRRLPFLCAMSVTRPTSSMMPVNIVFYCSAGVRKHLAMSNWHFANCQLSLLALPVRIPQISLHRKIFAEAVHLDPLYVSRFAHVGEAGAGGERHRTGAGQNLRSVVEEYLVHNTRGQRCAIDHGSAFDQQAGNLHGPEAAGDLHHIGTAVSYAHWYLFNPDSLVLQLAL